MSKNANHRPCRFAIATVACLLVSVAVDYAAAAENATPQAAVHGLLQRVLPAHADRFLLDSIPQDHGRDVFELESSGDKLVVRGSSGVAMASGIGWYLKHHCHCDFSWCGDQLRLPDTLPQLQSKLRRTSLFQYRYFFNYCAFSYTMAWWDWPQWERMIDWMALSGINMPLAVTGQEAVWQNVAHKLGLTDAEIAEFLVGPAYLPFGWMGCIDGWGGPLPQSWIDRHRELGQRILQRERSFGMTPVLQGFTGHVPVALRRVLPQARLRQLPSWCDFPGTYFLDPMDPLFRKVGAQFLQEQSRLFGSDHLYASDTFIEMSPPSNDPAFLKAMGQAVLASMQDADPQAVWIMQGWLFVNNPKFWQPPQAEALLTSVPADRLIVLDLMCESEPVWRITKAFYQKPWVFCIIQTFGDVVSLHGGLPQIADNLAQAMTDPKAGQLRGIGHIMEGLGANPVVHDFLADMTWRDQVPQVAPWVSDYVHRRYGRVHPKTQEAWKLLQESVYRRPGGTGTVLCSRPSLKAKIPPNEPLVHVAWQSLLAAANELNAVDTYQFDLVNVARQSLGNRAGPIYSDLLAACNAKDRKRVADAGRRLLELASDMDELLATRRELLLGRWLESATRWATNDTERRLYQWNARTQITLWGPPDSLLHEYARKQWSGMMRGFYGQRWRLFLKRLDESLASGKPMDEQQFEKDIRHWEDQWTRQTDAYPTAPHGDPVEVASRLWRKYGNPQGAAARN